MMPSRRIERIARAERRREPDQLQQRARRPEHLQPGERRRPAARASAAARSRTRTRCGARMSVERHDEAPRRSRATTASERPAERGDEAVARRGPGRRAREHARQRRARTRRRARRPFERADAPAAAPTAPRPWRTSAYEQRPRVERASPTSMTATGSFENCASSVAEHVGEALLVAPGARRIASMFSRHQLDLRCRRAATTACRRFGLRRDVAHARRRASGLRPTG